MAISNKSVEFMSNSFEKGRNIPGQSLTNSPDEPYRWEQPPEFTNPRETMLYIFEQLTVPETTANLLLSLTKGVSVIDIASLVLYEGFVDGKWNPDLMTLMMEPTMYMIMALAEKAEIKYVLDAQDDLEEEEIIGEKAVQQLESEIGSLDNIRKQAAQRVNPQSVPADVREVIEETELPQSLLQRIDREANDSLLAKEE